MTYALYCSAGLRTGRLPRLSQMIPDGPVILALPSHNGSGKCFLGRFQSIPLATNTVPVSIKVMRIEAVDLESPIRDLVAV